jgi:hypothetical protein
MIPKAGMYAKDVIIKEKGENMIMPKKGLKPLINNTTIKKVDMPLLKPGKVWLKKNFTNEEDDD